MRTIRLGSLLCVALLCLTIQTAFALRCSGRITSPGDTKWHIQDICGEPISIGIHQEAVTVEKEYEENQSNRKYQIEKDHTILIDYEIWRYKFKKKGLAYILIFRNDILIDEVTEEHYKGYWRHRKEYN
jgi:hypothetical protein